LHYLALITELNFARSWRFASQSVNYLSLRIKHSREELQNCFPVLHKSSFGTLIIPSWSIGSDVIVELLTMVGLLMDYN
jgi:hypothetical protein